MRHVSPPPSMRIQQATCISHAPRRLPVGLSPGITRLLGVMIILGVVFSLYAAMEAQAQDLRTPLVENVGEATEQVRPSHVDFWFHQEFTADSLLEALDNADNFATELRRYLIEAEASPVMIEASAPKVVDIYANAVLVSVQIRYTATSSQHPENGLRNFSRLCDKVRDAAQHFDNELVGPLMHVENKEEVVRSAVSDAVANAFLAADAVAGSLGANVYGVDTVQVLDINWNETPDTQVEEPTLRQASCTARVRVVYSLQDDG